MIYPPPAGSELTPEQARELDDTFLSSDPFAYFRSRIASLMVWVDTAGPQGGSLEGATNGTVRHAFNAYLQRPAADGPFRDLDVTAQVAADAFALRHHAAEALVRLALARLAPSPQGRGVVCLWAEVATGPVQVVEVLERLQSSAAEEDAGQRFFEAIAPPAEREQIRSNQARIGALNVYGEWLGYAGQLLSPGQEIDLYAAHNKVKHGLAVRARADMRLTLSSTPPADDGSIPLSALTGPDAIDVFDRPLLEILTRPKVDGHRQGLEVTQLRLNTAAMLADAFMLAMTHGALFHVAAAEHFQGRDDLPNHATAPSFPGYPIGGPEPEHIDAGAPLGMRFQLTEPPGGGANARESGIGFRRGFFAMKVDHGGGRKGRVVDDN